MGVEAGLLVAALFGTEQALRGWIIFVKERFKAGKLNDTEARYYLDRVFTRMREELLFIPLVMPNFKKTADMLNAVREKYSLCIALRDQHDELKEDKYYAFESEFAPTIKTLILKHNESTKVFQVEPLS